jgi:hypothetical protein
MDRGQIVPDGTPREVADRAGLGLDGQRRPSVSPTLDLPVHVPTHGTPVHRLVVIGDSLSHGFQSGAIFNTDLSFPAIIARELGWSDYRHPTYGKGPGEEPGQELGGLPLNVEYVLRRLAGELGTAVSVLEIPKAIGIIHHYLDQVEDYWERGPGRNPPPHGYLHDLGVYGWTLRDALTTTYASCAALVTAHTRDNLVNEFVESSTQRAAMRVYPNRPEVSRTQTVFAAAKAMGDDPESDGESGIETLIIMLGANNALTAVTDLRVEWTDDAYDTSQEFARVSRQETSADGRKARRRAYTVSRPDHFRAELAEVARQVKQIKARHVIWCTVPHVTIAPIAHGIPSKAEKQSRYFDYYVRPWIEELEEFRPDRDKHLTAADARAVDAAIDLYNDAIEQVVRDARVGADGVQRDWQIFELYGLLEGLATRRFDTSGSGLNRPDWLPSYALPPELLDLEDPAAGTSRPNTHFLSANGRGGRGLGGLFGLDGVHPTTIGYGIMAQELINIMSDAGVAFYDGENERQPPIRVNFDDLIAKDTLVLNPPQNIASIMSWARFVDHRVTEIIGLLGLQERVGPLTNVVSPGSPRSA